MKDLRPLLIYLRPYRWTYLAGLFLVALSNFFVAAGPRIPRARYRRASGRWPVR